MNNQKATKSTVSSLKLSGFKFDQESEEMWAKVENGELTTEDVQRITFEKIERLRIEKPEHFIALENKKDV